MKKEICVDFIYKNKFSYHTDDCKFSFDALQQNFEFEVPTEKGETIKITARIAIVGKSRVLTISSEKKGSLLFKKLKSKISEKINEKISMDVTVGIGGVGLSLMAEVKANKEKTKEERREIIYLLM